MSLRLQFCTKVMKTNGGLDERTDISVHSREKKNSSGYIGGVLDMDSLP